MIWRVLLATVICSALAGAAVPGNPQSALIFDPPVLEVVPDSAGFVQQMILVRSSSGDSVRLTSIDGSCRCATGSIQRPVAFDTVPGKFYIGINTQHFEDSVNFVDYTLGHTGSGGSSVFRVVVRLLPKDEK